MTTRRILIRRDTASAWTAANPTLASGELGGETDTGKLKLGDGSTAWNSLAYQAGVTSVNGSTGVVTGLAPTADPTFTGTVVLPSTTSIGDVSATELSYLNNVTSSIQTQIDAKAPIDNASFTGTFSAPSGTITSTMLADGTIVDADINASAAIAPTKISGTAVTASLVTTKGDVLVATASSTISRVGVGANGYALVADSSTDTGVTWALAGSPTDDVSAIIATRLFS